MATFNSLFNGSARTRYSWFRLKTVGTIILIFSGLVAGRAEPAKAAQQKRFDLWTAKVFREAEARYHADSNNVMVVQKLASACFDSADNAADDDQRANFAQLGITAANQLITWDAKSGPGHYFLAMDSGQLAKADAPSLTSYHLVKDMEKEFKMAQDLDEKFDFGGPSRNLGLLYRDAPGWPLSIGNRHKAREKLERATQIAPGYPENRLNLAESYLHWRDYAEARQELNALDGIWSNAQKQLTGPEWDQSWAEWADRREVLRKKLDEVFPAGKSSD